MTQTPRGVATRAASLVGFLVSDDPFPESLENGPVDVYGLPILHVAADKLARSPLQLLDSSLLVLCIHSILLFLERGDSTVSESTFTEELRFGRLRPDLAVPFR